MSLPCLLPNPGGSVAPADICGRDEQVTDYWRKLATQSIYLNDLRRIGKSMIMLKMHSDPPPGWVSIKQSLEGAHTAEEFVSLVYGSTHARVGMWKRGLRTVEALLGWMGGTEIAGFVKLPDGKNLPWKDKLIRTFAELEKQMAKLGKHLVFFWDEVPFMLDNIRKREGKQSAIEVLDLLRGLSQNYPHIRLFLTGSIGLHHVLDDLYGSGYVGSPFNHMSPERPGPLGTEDAVALSWRILEGARCQMEDPAACAEAVASLTGNVPCYIHKLISRLPSGRLIDPQSIEAVLTEELTSEHDDWDLGHYRRRLPGYYGARRAKIAVEVLDTVAFARAADFNRIRMEVNSQFPCEEDDLRELLTLLCRDHYIECGGDGHYRFYLEIIRRWWELSQDH